MSADNSFQLGRRKTDTLLYRGHLLLASAHPLLRAALGEQLAGFDGRIDFAGCQLTDQILSPVIFGYLQPITSVVSFSPRMPSESAFA